MSDRVIISLHEKGFWMADMYRDAGHLSGNEMEAMGLCCDDFMTFKYGQDSEYAKFTAQGRWPGAVVEIVWNDDEDDDDDEEGMTAPEAAPAGERK